MPVYSLRNNCRNTPRVATLVRLLSHLEPDYSRVLRPDDGIEPDLRVSTPMTEAAPTLSSACSPSCGATATRAAT